MKYAVNNMKQRFKSQAVVLSFFFDGKAKENEILMKSPLGFYRSLLHQILSIRPDLLSFSGTESVLSVFKKKQSMRSKTVEAWQWHEEELRGHLSAILAEAVMQTPVFVFIDALDECNNLQSIRDILKDLLNQTSKLCTTSARLRLCVSYRKYLNPISAKARNHQVICVEEQREHKIAIRKAVEENLQDIHDNIKRNAVQITIIRGAKGIFLWAILVCRQAVEMAHAGESTKKIEEVVGNVPLELEDLLKDLLIKIPENRQKQSLKLFQWICYAARPLSIEEIQYALAIEADMEEMTARQLKRRVDFREDLDDVERAVRALSQGLLEIRNSEGARVVQVIHQTAFQYLIDSGLDLLETLPFTDITAKRCIPKGTADCRRYEQLAQSCIKCLQMPLNDCGGRFPVIRPTFLLFNEKVTCDFQIKPPGHQDWIYIHDYIPLFEYALSSTVWHMNHGAKRTQSYVPRCLRSLDIATLWNGIFNFTESKLEYDSLFDMTDRRILSRMAHSQHFPPIILKLHDLSLEDSFGSAKRLIRASKPVKRVYRDISVAVQPIILKLPLCKLYWFTEIVESFQIAHLVVYFSSSISLTLGYRPCLTFALLIVWIKLFLDFCYEFFFEFFFKSVLIYAGVYLYF